MYNCVSYLIRYDKNATLITITDTIVTQVLTSYLKQIKSGSDYCFTSYIPQHFQLCATHGRLNKGWVERNSLSGILFSQYLGPWDTRSLFFVLAHFLPMIFQIMRVDYGQILRADKDYLALFMVYYLFRRHKINIKYFEFSTYDFCI